MRIIVAIVTLAAVGMLGAGCTHSPAESGDAADDAAAASPGPVLSTRGWGVVDGMLSVVVQNTTHRTLRAATGVITARDDHDVLVASSLETTTQGCCSVTDLPPGQEFGFYLDLGDAAARVDEVDVAYRDVSWAPAADTGHDPLVARPVRIDAGPRDTVVVADVRNAGSMVGQASVQAMLDGPDGDFLAVVAGRWYCFSPGLHRIRMQLPHPVPDGVKVDRVVIHPVGAGPDGARVHCAGSARAG